MEAMELRTVLTLLLGGKMHLMFCLFLLFFSQRNRSLFVLILILTCQSVLDLFAHFMFKTFLKDYAYHYWFITYVLTQSLFILGIIIKQKYFGKKLKIDQIMIVTGYFLLLLQVMGLISLNGFQYKGEYLQAFHSVGVQSLFIIQFTYLAFAVAESRKGHSLLKGK